MKPYNSYTGLFLGITAGALFLVGPKVGEQLYLRGLDKGLRDGRSEMKSAVIVNLQERVHTLDDLLENRGRVSQTVEATSLRSEKDALWSVLHELFSANDDEYFCKRYFVRNSQK